jgi:hypothetical protein
MQEQTNGGETVDIVIEHPETEGSQQEETQLELKEPIFIGQIDHDLLQKIDELIDKEIYEIAVLSPSIQQSCRETYFFHKLGEKQRDDMLKQKMDEKMRKETLDAIAEIERLFIQHFKNEGINYDKESGQLITFKAYEMKNVINAARTSQLSNEKTRELLEHAQIQGFITPTISGATYVKQEFAITIDSASRLTVLNGVKNALSQEIEMLKHRVKLYENEIVVISQELIGDSEETNKTDHPDVEEFAINALTEKSKKVLELIKAHPGKYFTSGQISKMYNDNVSSCNDIIPRLLKINAILKKQDKKEKEKDSYCINPKIFNL